MVAEGEGASCKFTARLVLPPHHARCNCCQHNGAEKYALAGIMTPLTYRSPSGCYWHLSEKCRHVTAYCQRNARPPSDTPSCCWHPRVQQASKALAASLHPGHNPPILPPVMLQMPFLGWLDNTPICSTYTAVAYRACMKAPTMTLLYCTLSM